MIEYEETVIIDCRCSYGCDGLCTENAGALLFGDGNDEDRGRGAAETDGSRHRGHRGRKALLRKLQGDDAARTARDAERRVA